nr:aminotransferase class IV [Lysinibacter cavernae]
MVADSFRVSNGTVIAHELHRDRFVMGCILMGYSNPAELANFWREATLYLADASRGDDLFPRVELLAAEGGHRLALLTRSIQRLGEAPESIILSSSYSDPRRLPTIKGPNIALFSRLNARASETAQYPIATGDPGPTPVHDTIICTSDGTVIEGTTTSLLWWNNNTLHRVPTARPRVSSVTERILIEAAGSLEIPVAETDAKAHTLANHEVWAVNALHGIRPVAHIDGVPTPQVDADRLARFAEARASLATGIGD